jgi:hypothetical protein
LKKSKLYGFKKSSSAHTNDAFFKKKNEKTISICQLYRELHYTWDQAGGLFTIV